jgi:hypothetical protein
MVAAHFVFVRLLLAVFGVPFFDFFEFILV